MCRSIISLIKILHQMWYGYPFSQRNKATERVVEVGVKGDREGWLDEILRRGENRQYKGRLHEIGELGPLCELCCIYLAMVYYHLH